MSRVDKERIAAVDVLRGLGWAFDGVAWVAPAGGTVSSVVTDAMHGLLMDRAEALAGCTEGSAEAEELEAVSDALEEYEAARWPRDSNVRG